MKFSSLNPIEARNVLFIRDVCYLAWIWANDGVEITTLEAKEAGPTPTAHSMMQMLLQHRNEL